MCETRDLGIKWPQCHTFLCEGQVQVDVRYVCPKDVKNMLMKQAQSICWRKWAAKHEYEELKQGTWLEPALALLRRKTKDELTDKHRHVERKMALEGGLVQRDSSTLVGQVKVSAKHVTKRKAQKSTRVTIVQVGVKLGAKSKRPAGSGSQIAITSKKEWKWPRSVVTHPLRKSQWNRSHFSVKKWESEKHKSWGRPAEGFHGHVVADGSLLGMAGKR